MSVNGLGPYPAYRDSGVQWLGRVPKHWEVRRSKTVFRCIDERSETGSEELLTVSSDRGIVPRDSTSVTMFKARSYVGHKLCWPGDLVINSLWAWSRGLGVSRYHGIVSTAYGVYRVRRKARVLPDFIHSLVRSEAFNWELRVRSKGIWISRLQLTDDSFLRAPLPLPPLSEQGAIARFLEAADRRIQRYIRAKERLIELLQERKRALIHEAVTGRTDVSTGQPYPAYKDSGVEWLGKVPKHWDVRRLKGVAKILNGATPASGRSEYWGGDILWVTPEDLGQLRGRDIRRSRRSITRVGYESCGTTLAPVGSTVVSTRAPIGHLAILGREGCTNQGCRLLVPNNDAVVPEWAYLGLLTARSELQALGQGTTFAELSRDGLGAFALPLPPLSEQTAIARFLEAADRRIQGHVSATKRQIALLKEYRTRLIADVVTGKLDVREASARLPETDPLATNRNRTETIPTESNLHSTAHDMARAEAKGG